MAGIKAGADSGRRALDVLFAFTEQRPQASARELAESLDIPLPSVHRYIALLRDMGLVEEAGRGRYHLSMRVAALGRAARRAAPIVDLLEPHMRALTERTGESTLLMRLVNGAPVCIHRVESASRFRLSFEPGQALPKLRGASVRLLLGALTHADRVGYVDGALAEGAAPPPSGRDGFLEQIEQDVARGWSISNEEIDEGVWAAAAALHEDGRVVAALSLPCPAFRVSEEMRTQYIELVRTTADEASRSLGS